MLADQFLEAAGAAKNTASVDAVARLIWRAHAEGQLADADAEAIGEALAARRRAFAAGVGLPAPKVVFAVLRPPRASPRSPDRRQSIERRRRQAMSGVVPSKIAAGYTLGELAVLTVIGRLCQRGGACSLPIDAIAALAGVCRTTAQNALRAARAGGLMLVRERRIPGRRSLTNVVTVVSRDWLGWLKLGNTGFKKMSPTEDSRFKGRDSAPLRGLVLAESDRPPGGRGIRKGGAARIHVNRRRT
jgi:hypothetical protein